MYIKGFNVELLVDNKPLKECIVPITKLEVHYCLFIFSIVISILENYIFILGSK